jgi:tRNA 2-thiocytidine biosynthesis protein TtcA
MNTHFPQPPWSALGRRLESAVRKALYEFQMIEDGRVAVALSGGKDSLALLYLLKAISGRGFPVFDLAAIHVAGEFSCGAGVNEGYLRGLCDQLEVPLVVRESTQKLETLECYRCSRERRKLIFDAAKSLGMRCVAFGHHADDSAQTLLMNLLHKGEFEGNLPKIQMHQYGVTIIRPLIFLTEEEIRVFAQQQGFLRVTCRCPVGENAMRKQVDSLMTEMEKLFPNARGNIASAGLRYSSGKAGMNDVH